MIEVVNELRTEAATPMHVEGRRLQKLFTAGRGDPNPLQVMDVPTGFGEHILSRDCVDLAQRKSWKRQCYRRTGLSGPPETPQ